MYTYMGHIQWHTRHMCTYAILYAFYSIRKYTGKYKSILYYDNNIHQLSPQDTNHAHVYALTTKFLLEALNSMLVNPCILHGLHQHSPCGGLVTFASTPSDQPFLYCFFLIQGMGSEACTYCGCVKFYSFKDCPCFVCSVSAHKCSEELEIAWTACRESRVFTPTSLTYGDLHLYHTQQPMSVTAYVCCK